MDNSTEFTCNCGKQRGWITDTSETSPCPKCGRRYRGVYSEDKLTIIAEEIVEEK